MKKAKKRIFIGAGVLAVALGGAAVAGKAGQQEQVLPQVEMTEAVLGDVQQTVDATGTVVSEEEKTFFSPVNAQIQEMNFEQGDSVKKGEELLTFNLENLERDNQKAQLNVRSGEADYEDAIKKSDQAEKKQKDAKSNVASLEKKVEEKKAYVASLKSQLSAVTAQSQRDAQAAAQAEAQAQAAQAAAQAEAQRQAEEARNQEIQRQYSAALTTYRNETLPAYQRELGEASARSNQALSEYNQAETAYQMAFSVWTADASEENTQALEAADQARSQAQIAYQEAKGNYEAMKLQQPAMPVMSDFMDQADAGDFVTDGTVPEVTDQAAAEVAQTGGSSYTAPDTSGLESALEQASSDLAELQSELASEKAVAEADAASLSEEQKEKMDITNNLTELEAKTAEELVEEGKKGIHADFNGVISKASVQEGATVSQGMELFTLQNTDDVSVDISISKYDYDKVKEGQKAEITMADKSYEGTVTKVSHIAVPNEKGTPLISATVSIDDPDENIFLGVDAKVKIQAAEARNVVVLPIEVVNIGKNGSFCYTVEDGVITRKDIETGISSDDMVEVTEGLEAGDQVILDIGELSEGMPVQTASETGESADE
ncbi:MAG: efflux RND transporter periplasmic adaptor subunit [Eubacteriales bacterium]|nr:efflux RND transporter periplasmic adaptor subunit [Eubacteriales bacterium]